MKAAKPISVLKYGKTSVSQSGLLLLFIVKLMKVFLSCCMISSASHAEAILKLTYFDAQDLFCNSKWMNANSNNSNKFFTTHITMAKTLGHIFHKLCLFPFFLYLNRKLMESLGIWFCFKLKMHSKLDKWRRFLCWTTSK